MSEIKIYEDFEIDEINDDVHMLQTNCKSFCKTKLLIIFSLILLFEIIHLLFVIKKKRNKNDQLSVFKFQEYRLNENIEKLHKQLKEDDETIYSLDKEINKKEKEIKTKEEGIKYYLQKSNYLLNNNRNSETIFTIQIEINKKQLEIDELLLSLNDIKKSFQERFKSTIIDSDNELNKIQSLLNQINVYDFKRCYGGESKKLNFTEAYNSCNLNEDKSFLIVFETNLYERYGIYLSTQKEEQSIIFSFNFEKEMEKEYIKINNSQRQSLIYLINLIKNMKLKNNNLIAKNENEKRNVIEDFDIIGLEIFHI